MADTVIENLITKLSFDYDQKNISKFNEGITTAVKSLAAVVAGVTAAVAGIAVFTTKTAAVIDEVGKLSEITGVNVEALQELGYVAELNGSSVEAMNGTLRDLSRITSEASRGLGEGVEVFGMLGLSATDAEGKVKGADAMLMEISDSLSKLGSQAEKLEFAQKLGIGPELLLSIQGGSEALEKQRQQARDLGFIYGKELTKTAAEYNDRMLDVRRVLEGIGNTISGKLMKRSTEFFKIILKWIDANKALIKLRLEQFFEGLAKAINIVTNVAVRIYNIITGLVEAMGGWKNAIIAVTAVWMALNATALLFPLIIVAAAAGILLLIEDIQKFAEGGDSALGALIEKFPALEEPIRFLIWYLGQAWDALLRILSGETWDQLKFIFNDLKNEVIEFIDLVKEKFNALTDIITKPFKEAIDKLPKFVKSKLGIETEEPDEYTPTDLTSGLVESLLTIPNIGEGVSPIPSAAAGGTTNTTNTSSSTTNNTSNPSIKIEINGGDTEAIKKTVTDIITDQYKGAAVNYETRVGV